MYESRLSRALPRDRMPQHIGVVVDGNRRWAKLAGTPTADGHLAGAHKIVEFIDWCAELGIPTVTLYMLSTDNMNRSADELDQLMEIIGDTLDRLAESRPGGRPVRVHPVGALDLLPEPLAARLRQLGERNAAEAGEAESEDAGDPGRCDDPRSAGEAGADADGETVTTRTGSIRRIVRRSRGQTPAVHVNVAVGYGGRQEIVDAVKELLRQAETAGRGLSDVAEELTPGSISQWLYTRGQPDPDLIIRTSGEQRLSGFLMWQSAYSEFYFCEALWPDFRRVDFIRALRDYAQRQRRFGG
ncbi:polyprenyl diphosphate synthase [Nesterenkonia suensis]